MVWLLRNSSQFHYRTLNKHNMKTTTFFAFVFMAMTAVLATPVPNSEIECTSPIPLVRCATYTDAHSRVLVNRLDAAFFAPAAVTPVDP